MRLILLASILAWAAPTGKTLVDFEDGALPSGWTIKAPRPHSITAQSSIVRSGKFAGRFELRKGEAFINRGKPDGFRAELKERFNAPRGSEHWYSISLYLPKDFPIHDNRLVLSQWNAEPDPGEEELERSPPLSQRFIDGKFRILLYKEPLTKKLPATGRKVIYETKDFELGRWHDLIYHVKWSHNKDGFVRAWMNGKQIVDYNGPVGYDDKEGPYFKFGLYRDDVPETYVAYFDDYRRGKTRAEVER